MVLATAAGGAGAGAGAGAGVGAGGAWNPGCGCSGVLPTVGGGCWKLLATTRVVYPPAHPETTVLCRFVVLLTF